MKSTIYCMILLACCLTPAHAKDYPLVVKVIAYEASGESLQGQIAVASVIKTRMNERRKTAEQVVSEPYQFSCICPKTHQFTQSRALTEQELKSAEKAWNQAKIGIYNHYHTLSVHPSWSKHAKNKIIIGNHVFMSL